MKLSALRVPGGNQVDGLPPARHSDQGIIVFEEILIGKLVRESNNCLDHVLKIWRTP